MAISGVNPKCYILALFVRNDGARFLLGDDPYEFKDKQLHFQQNTIANDVVEVQGNDGYLLAGQVRRPGSQTFDGYVCNGTNSKEEVETKRRAFLQFFRRSHFYKVIYVFPNGTAIQRKQGFLVDDPTVQELYQQYPEYHVALNFEDVNYYTYEEDDQGQEIYAKEAIVKLAGGGATGGLIWDNYGVVWEDPWNDPVSVSGTEIQIENEAGARAPIENLELQGDTYQNGTPTPDAPVVVQTVAGEQTVSVTGKNLFNPALFDGITAGANGRYATSKYYSASTEVVFNLKPNTSYTLSLRDENYDLSGTAWSAAINGTWKNILSGSLKITTDSSGQFTLKIGASSYSNIGSNERFIQLEEGSTATEYRPYTGQTYTIDLGSIELCKIGNYQDYIYNSGDDWYVHKECGKLGNITANNFGGYTVQTRGIDVVYCYSSTFDNRSATEFVGYSNVLINNGKNVQPTDILTGSVYAYGGSSATYARLRLWIDKSLFSDTSSSTAMKNGLATLMTANPFIFYYALTTPTDTKITDATLVGQLEALGAMKLFIGENNLLVSATGTNLPATLEFSYPTKFAAIGAEWEEGGTNGATIVDVDAIDNTYPVWELIGPATNPTISVLTTNTTLTYNGTITASQKLVIDMFNKTATLNGTSVIGNVSGDFVYMAPGTNRVAYTADNTDAPDSTIYWQEVVG